MSNRVATFTPTATGTLTISSLGFDPNDLTFEVGAKNGSSSNLTYSIGHVDENGNEGCISGYFDGGQATFNNYSDRCIQIWYHNGSTWVQALNCSFNGFVTGGFSLTVNNYDTNYQVRVTARQT